MGQIDRPEYWWTFIWTLVDSIGPESIVSRRHHIEREYGATIPEAMGRSATWAAVRRDEYAHATNTKVSEPQHNLFYFGYTLVGLKAALDSRYIECVVWRNHKLGLADS